MPENYGLKRADLNAPRGFTLIEVTMAILLIGVISVVLAGFYSVLFNVPVEIVVKNKANNLASAAIEDIKCRDWEDPAGPGPLGIDAGENAANKTTFDDIDDFNGYTESPPRYMDGTVMPGMSGFSVNAAVSYVDDNLNVSAAATDRKRVTVTVKKNNVPKISVCTVLSRQGKL